MTTSNNKGDGLHIGGISGGSDGDMYTCSACGSLHGDCYLSFPFESGKYIICDACIFMSYDTIMQRLSSHNEHARNLRETATGLLTSIENIVTTTDAAPTNQITRTPSEIVKELDKYIVGQDEAKKILAIGAYHHYRKTTDANINFNKSNVLLIGPTGSGKTAMIEHLANFLNVPFVVYDCTQLTETGYIGEDMSDVISALYTAADKDKDKTERGIVCLDEVDKLRVRPSNSKDVGGAGVQRMLLKSLENNNIKIASAGGRGRGSTIDPQIDINTKNILFIASGAFVDLPEIINERLAPKGSMGFSAALQTKSEGNYDQLIDKVETDDLIAYGMIPEFLGRFSAHGTTRSITPEIIKTLLKTKTPHTDFGQIWYLLNKDRVTFSISDEAIDEIANRVIKLKTGVRGIRTILNKELLETMFSAPNQTGRTFSTLILEDGKFKVITTHENDTKQIAGTIASE